MYPVWHDISLDIERYEINCDQEWARVERCKSTHQPIPCLVISGDGYVRVNCRIVAAMQNRGKAADHDKRTASALRDRISPSKSSGCGGISALDNRERRTAISFDPFLQSSGEVTSQPIQVDTVLVEVRVFAEAFEADSGRIHLRNHTRVDFYCPRKG